jgi:fluoride exporter
LNEGIVVIKIGALVFVGGAVGAMLREFLMLMVPILSRGFPLDILTANVVAAFLLGLIAGLHSRNVASDRVYALIGIGITGGLSTFSSFAYGSFELMTHSATDAVVASVYIMTSLVIGYIALIAGMKIGKH